MTIAAFKVDPRDDVAATLRNIAVGEQLLGVTAAQDIPRGHKIALHEKLDESRTANAELSRRIQPLKDSIAAIEEECARLTSAGTATEEARSSMTP